MRELSLSLTPYPPQRACTHAPPSTPRPKKGWPQSGVGSEIITLCAEEAFDYMDAPPERVSHADVPLPYAVNLEALCLPQPDLVARVVERVVARPFK